MVINGQGCQETLMHQQRQKSIEELLEEDKQDENLRRIRRVRDELHRQYPSIEALSAFLDEYERKARNREAKARAAKPKSRKSAAAKSSRSVTASR
jgi:hypothetical protein